MKTLLSVIAEAIVEVNGATPEIAEGAAGELVDQIRRAGFLILPPAHVSPPPAVMAEVAAERMQQDQQWGGAAHDDKLESDDWVLKINLQADAAMGVGGPEFRERMVKIAALGVAAVQAWDRNDARPQPPSS